MYLIDTNIFLQILLKRDKSKECKEMLKKAREKNITLTTTMFSIHTIELHLQARGKLDAAINFIKDLIKSDNINIYNTFLSDEIEIIKIVKNSKLDFDDALQFHVAKQLGCEAIISFDKDFDSLEIPRVEPSEILKKMN